MIFSDLKGIFSAECTLPSCDDEEPGLRRSSVMLVVQENHRAHPLTTAATEELITATRLKQHLAFE